MIVKICLSCHRPQMQAESTEIHSDKKLFKLYFKFNLCWYIFRLPFFVSWNIFFASDALKALTRRSILPLRTQNDDVFFEHFYSRRQKQKANTLLRFLRGCLCIVMCFLSYTSRVVVDAFFVEWKEADAMFLILPFFSSRKFSFSTKLVYRVFRLSQLIVWRMEANILFRVKGRFFMDFTQGSVLNSDLKFSI